MLKDSGVSGHKIENLWSNASEINHIDVILVPFCEFGSF